MDVVFAAARCVARAALQSRSFSAHTLPKLLAPLLSAVMLCAYSQDVRSTRHAS
jgi:hypothetical protein